MSEQTTPPAETPRQIQIHTVIMILDLAGRASQIFHATKAYHAGTLTSMVRSIQEKHEHVRLERDLRLRIQKQQEARVQEMATQALKDLFSSVEYISAIGMGNIDELRDAIETLQKECGCEKCLKDHDANLLTRLADATPRHAPRFTGSHDQWIPKILAEQKARREAAAPSPIIKP